MVFDSRYSWIRLAITLVISIVGNVGLWAVIVVLPSMEAEFGTSRSVSSLPYTVTMAGYAFGNLLFGRVVDRFGLTICVLGAAALVGGGFLLAAAAPSIALVSAIQLMIGLGTGACFGPLMADISQWFMRRRGIAVAIVASGNYLSGAIWPWLLSDILAAEGWRPVYTILAALAVAVMVPFSLAFRRRVPEEAQSHAAATAAFAARATTFQPAALMWMLALAGIGCCVAMSMPQVHIVALCGDLGYGPAVGAEMLSIMLLCGVVSRVASGFIADRIGGAATLLIGSTLQCLALIAFLPASGLASLYAVTFLFGLSQGGIVPSYAIVVREYMPPKEAGTRTGIVIFATIVGMALGGWLSGAIHDATGGYRWAFLNGIAFNLMNIAIIGLIVFSNRRPGARPVVA